MIWICGGRGDNSTVVGQLLRWINPDITPSLLILVDVKLGRVHS